MDDNAPSLPHIPGLAWRPATMLDVPALVRWVAVVDEVEDLEFAGGPEFWRWWLEQQDLVRDTILAVDSSGEVLGAAGSWGQVTDQGARAILWLDAHPDHLELEEVLLAWAEHRGWEQLDVAPHPERVIRVSVEEHRTRRRSLLETAGFAAMRTFVEMERPLDESVGEAHPAPPGVEIVGWDPALDEATRIASNAAFAGHWGSLPMDAATFRSMVIDEEVIRRDLSFLALAGDQVVGMCLVSVDAEEDPDRLWIDRVGTIPSWQRRGVAKALLSRSLQAGAAAGLATSGLSVDEASDYDATALYAELGYEVTSRSVTYIKSTAP
jgi:ribosomal protein S18 acetylase RimI-like enzyme